MNIKLKSLHNFRSEFYNDQSNCAKPLCQYQQWSPESLGKGAVKLLPEKQKYEYSPQYESTPQSLICIAIAFDMLSGKAPVNLLDVISRVLSRQAASQRVSTEIKGYQVA
eukprot:scaffold134881_cov46-Cyclotella_meneghiniana.AAC.1